MQYDVSTPDEYLRALGDDWRRDTLVALRTLIKRTAPELTESIRYKMLSYDDHGCRARSSRRTVLRE